MDWSNERYVRLYTRDTADMVAVGWEGRLVLYELLRKVDRSGVLDHGGEVELVPELLRLPHDIFLSGFARLVKREVVIVTDRGLFVRNFLDAQEADQTDRQRQSESRKRRMEKALAEGASLDEARRLARPDRYKDGSQRVTAGHSGSQRVTPSLAEPSRAEPDLLSSQATTTGKVSSNSPNVRQATAAVIGAFNKAFSRDLSPTGWEDAVRRVLAKGYTEAQMRGVVWWAAREWGEDSEKRRVLTPKTLLKLQSSQGYRTFHEYLSCAGERWRAEHEGQVPPWEPKPVQPRLGVVG